MKKFVLTIHCETDTDVTVLRTPEWQALLQIPDVTIDKIQVRPHHPVDSKGRRKGGSRGSAKGGSNGPSQ